MSKTVRRIRRVLRFLGVMFVFQLIAVVFWAIDACFLGLTTHAWNSFWGLGFPHLRDAVFCFVLAWIVGRLGQGTSAEEEAEKKEE